MRLREKEHRLSPEEERELAALDAALADRPVDARHAALAELARELRVERPRPRPDFVAELDFQAAAGFRAWDADGHAVPAPGPRDRLVAHARELLGGRPRRLAGALGAAATLIVVVAVAISQSGELGRNGAEPGGDTAATQAEPAPAQPAPSGAAGAAPGVAEGRLRLDLDAERSVIPPPVPPGPGGGIARGQAERKVERAAQMTLSTEADRVQDVADRAIEVAEAHRGIVLSSQVNEGAGERARASLELAIPSERLEPALADLSDLADVKSRSDSSIDVTAPFVSARERLNDARAELESLLRQLAEAATPLEAESIRKRIRIVRDEVAAARAQFRSIARTVRFARVSVAVEGDGSQAGAWTLGDALDDALRVLAVVLGVLLVSAAVLVPLALVVAAAWIGRQAWVRRRRETALDAL
jgi:hypothetical protein